jgi:hypothetical protein
MGQREIEEKRREEEHDLWFNQISQLSRSSRHGGRRG